MARGLTIKEVGGLLARQLPENNQGCLRIKNFGVLQYLLLGATSQGAQDRKILLIYNPLKTV